MVTHGAERIEHTDDPSRVIGSNKFPVVSTHGDYIYERHRVTSGNMWRLRRRALPFEEIMRYGPFRTPTEIINNIQPGKEVVFARTKGLSILGRQIIPSKDVGVVTQQVKKVEVDGQPITVLSIGVKAIELKYRRRGIARQFAIDAIKQYRPDVVTGQTRNEYVTDVYETTGFVLEITPLDRSYNGKDREVLRGALSKKVLARVDLETGLLHDGTYPPAEESQFSQNIRLRPLGVDPKKGNGVRYLAWLNQEIDETAIAKDKTAQIPVSVGSRPFLEAIAERLAAITRVLHFSR